MSNISGISGTGSNLDTQRRTIADNFDTFLQLLITQLKNQNPLEPMDTNQFTQQLVQFTSVEQQLKTNEYLQAMLASTQNTTNTQAVAYVGKTVTASGTTTELRNGQAAWVFKLDKPAENTMVTIKDQKGNVVYTQEMSLKAGTDDIIWDGTTSTGAKLTEGRFTITIDARDSNGAYVPVTTQLMGVVEAVDFSGNEPMAIIGGLRVPLSSITSVAATMPPAGDKDA
ncbi:flagellar hook assembly protein FlgD [Pelagibacterium limicola]|uniref:flagellar hook assembly protein FlgD n=1 Tax=Pelagibacterium limicola TaxID=2791022 RepID=UPI0018AFCF0F|nr:flagellar hook capping FlgD N-terminal domain-containing protein [Pelagibacterium limicola]